MGNKNLLNAVIKEISSIFLKVFLVFIFVGYLQAQTQISLQSGNIRSCEVWDFAIFSPTLSDAVVSSGHTITANTNASVNSMTFSSSTSALSLNSGQAVSFGSSTSASVCIQGTSSGIFYSDIYSSGSTTEISMGNFSVYGLPSSNVNTQLAIDLFRSNGSGTFSSGICKGGTLAATSIEIIYKIYKNGTLFSTITFNSTTFNLNFSMPITINNGDFIEIKTIFRNKGNSCTGNIQYNYGYTFLLRPPGMVF